MNASASRGSHTHTCTFLLTISFLHSYTFTDVCLPEQTEQIAHWADRLIRVTSIAAAFSLHRFDKHTSTAQFCLSGRFCWKDLRRQVVGIDVNSVDANTSIQVKEVWVLQWMTFLCTQTFAILHQQHFKMLKGGNFKFNRFWPPKLFCTAECCWSDSSPTDWLTMTAVATGQRGQRSTNPAELNEAILYANAPRSSPRTLMKLCALQDKPALLYTLCIRRINELFPSPVSPFNLIFSSVSALALGLC